ncbi:MAG: ABC transporter ATP-binding protein [Lachnospiraceae bacterium]|nr:ABC transporter ATP-binding protein [Lachnospiraceae bacterium]
MRLIGHILEHKIRLVLIAFGIIITTVVNIGISLFLKIVIDDYITPLLLVEKEQVDFTPLRNIIILFSLVLATAAILSYLYRYLMVKLSNGILRDIREQMFSKMQYFPIKYFDTNKAGDIMSKYTNDLDTFRQVISQTIPETVKGILTFVLVIASMIMLSVNLLLVVLAMCFIMFLFTRWVGINSLRSYRKTQKSISDLNTYVEEMVLGAKEVKVYCYEDRNMENFSKKNDEWGVAVKSADTISNILMPCMNSLGNIMYVFIAFAGGIMLINNVPNISILGEKVLTIGTISSFLTFTKTFSGLIAELSGQVPFIAQSMSGAERIFDLLDTDVEVDEGTYILSKKTTNDWEWVKEVKNSDEPADIVKKDVVPLVGKIVLEDVNFSYVEGRQILKNINVYADKGEKVALVGATGAGKTTITNLINRFYEIDSGRLTYDGINIKEIKKKDLRDSFSVVLQDVNLWTGTILENIRYGKLEASDEECIAAAKLVQANSFIEMLPDGYNTMIKGDAGGLSQGQKQLISIARAAVANPPCLILDEATSSIDTRTEKLVQKGMVELMKGRTVFIIAHRLSTIRDADVIMVMQEGEIIERGNHKSLMEKKGRYYELYTGKIEID